MQETSKKIVKVAVIGGGVAGLACARELVARGAEVVVFDKGRAAGGRVASRRFDGAHVDLGAQYFTARDPAFVALVQRWEDDGVVARWDARIGAADAPGAPIIASSPTARFVGMPSMNAIVNDLARALDVRPCHRVDAIARAGDRLFLRGTSAPGGETLPPLRDGEAGDCRAASAGREELGEFDAVAVCAPPAQASALVVNVAPELCTAIAAVDFVPCLALAIATEDPQLAALAYDGVFVGRDDEQLISWVARDSSKPGRLPGERWVLHAGARWSVSSWSDPTDDVASSMLAAFRTLLGLEALAPTATTFKRWAYARSTSRVAPEALVARDVAVGLGGDWTHGGRVEGAFLSGTALARRLLVR